LTRSAALIGALRAISIFVRAHAASRFDCGFLACTAKPYVAPGSRIAAQHRMFAQH
jgi:hypothetical protein